MARGQVAKCQVASRKVARGPPARGQLARGPPCGKRARRPRERVLCSEDLYSWWGGVEKVTYWLKGKGGTSFPGETWLPKCRYGWQSVSPNTCLAPDSICSFCICDGRKAVNQNCLWVFFGQWRPPPLLPFRLGWIQSQGFPFPASGDDTHRLSRAPPSPHCHSFTCCSEHLAALLDQAQHYRVRELLLLAPCIKFFVKLQWWGPCLYFSSGCLFHCNKAILINFYQTHNFIIL